MTEQAAKAPTTREFEREVRGALASLYDVPRLQIHPLVRFCVVAFGAREATAGHILQRYLREAIDALRPRGDGAGERAARIHHLLMLRYVEGLEASVAWRQLGIGKSEYHREHGRAIRAVASILKARWQVGSEAALRQTSSRAALPRLPRPLTRLIGRGPELTRLKHMVETERLVTLTGPGGCGKTRLAIELALEVAPTLVDGVWWIDLAALSDAALVPNVVLASMRAREIPGQPILDTLVSHLGSRSALLVFDNCEHLIAACAQFAESLLQACSGARVLATSREALGIGGEVLWHVPPLTFPESRGQPLSMEAIAEYDAVRLFVDRARLVRPDFSLTPASAQVVARVCVQLDGIPLAIELAASRMNVLSADELLARLDDRFHILTTASRTLPVRHQALSATVEWSYQLLSDLEKRLFARLSVFAGGFTLRAAEHVGSCDGVQSANVLDLLARLVDKSLIVCEERDGQIRYRLLETLREYASDRLRESGEYEAARSRHLDYCLRLAEGTNAHLGFFLADAATAIWLNRIQSEEDNLRAALQWSEVRVDARERGQRLACVLHWFWFVRGRFSEGRGRLQRLLDHTGGERGVRARALVVAGYLSFWKGDFSDAAPLLAESLTLFTEQPDWTAFALCGLGAAASGRGEHVLARSQLDAALAAARRIDDHWVTAFALHFLAQSATNTGDVALATSLLMECIGMLEQLGGNKGGTAFSLLHLGRLAREHGDLLTARNRGIDALRLFVELDDRRGIAYALVGLAGVSLAEGDGRTAAHLLAASDTLRAAGGPFLEAAMRTEVERDVAAAHATLGDDEFTSVWRAGHSMPVDETIAVVLGATLEQIEGISPVP